MKNEIIDEVRRNRKAILDASGGDVRKMMLSLMARQKKRGRKVVTLGNPKPEEGVLGTRILSPEKTKIGAEGGEPGRA